MKTLLSVKYTRQLCSQNAYLVDILLAFPMNSLYQNL